MAAKVLQYPASPSSRRPGSIHLNSANFGRRRRSSPARSGSGLRKHWFGYSFLSHQEVKLGVSISSTGVRDILPDRPGARITPPNTVGREAVRAMVRPDLVLQAQGQDRRRRQPVPDGPDPPGQHPDAHRGARFDRPVTLALGADSTTTRISGSVEGRHGLRLRPFHARADADHPQLKLYGTGSTGVNSSVAGLDLDGDGAPDDFLAADYSDRLPASFRTPLSLAPDDFQAPEIAHLRQRRVVRPIRPYTVVDSEDFEAQTAVRRSRPTSATTGPRREHGLRSGIRPLVRFKSYISYSTDARPAVRERRPTSRSRIGTFNTSSRGRGHDQELGLTFGLGYSFGNRESGRGRGPRPAGLETSGTPSPPEVPLLQLQAHRRHRVFSARRRRPAVALGRGQGI